MKANSISVEESLRGPAISPRELQPLALDSMEQR